MDGVLIALSYWTDKQTNESRSKIAVCTSCSREMKTISKI